MRTQLLLIGLLLPLLCFGQYEQEKDMIISEYQKDDIYRAGENVKVNALVNGDAVIAAGTVTVRDTIRQDLLVAGGDITVKGYVADDVRAAGGKLNLEGEVGDDLVVFGGEVIIEKTAIIHGNLISFAGDIIINGQVLGMVKANAGELVVNGNIGENAELYGGEIIINSEIKGPSKLAAENLVIGESAKFYKDVEYWSGEGEIDFDKNLVNASSHWSENLDKSHEEFSWRGFGIMALGFWVFYLFSAFLVLLLLNWAFGNFFSTAADYLDKRLSKSLLYGMIYLIGLPLLIVITFVIVIGIPIGLFLSGFYLFSLLFGHLVTALLLAHYLNKRSDKGWNFWTIILLALGIASVIRLLTFIPFLGTLLSFVVIAIGYGLVSYTLLQKKAALKLRS